MHTIKLLWEWYLGRMVWWLPMKGRTCVVFEPCLQGRNGISMKEKPGHLYWNFDIWPMGGLLCLACDGSSASPAFSHQACSNSDGCATWKGLASCCKVSPPTHLALHTKMNQDEVVHLERWRMLTIIPRVFKQCPQWLSGKIRGNAASGQRLWLWRSLHGLEAPLQIISEVF